MAVLGIGAIDRRSWLVESINVGFYVAQNLCSYIWIVAAVVPKAQPSGDPVRRGGAVAFRR
jgi:hypothetical protein